MTRRKSGTILPIEAAILEHGSSHDEFYGFALARALVDDTAALTGHGTLYKALSRMTSAGLLESSWENPDIAERERRPRRRLYSITAEGTRTLAALRSAGRASETVTSRKVSFA
jgi:PadR family transcriptional regulator, regulatory protein PadR